MRRLLSMLIAGALTWLALAASAAADPGLALGRPVPGPVVTAFSIGPATWSPGHRGADLAGTPGEPVRAAAAGRVHFAGWLVSRGVVSVAHGGLRTTYEPVTLAVREGDEVAAGDVIGYLAAGHDGCPVAACLHWGLTDGDAYFDPVLRLSAPETRLLPDGIRRAYAPPPPVGARSGGSALVWPASGRPGSPFGWRLHPILGYWRMHWGTDIGAACGSPLLAAADGVVVERRFSGGHGNRLVLDFGTVRGAALRIGYSHASSYIVAVGQRVRAGQVVGYVGSTGLSTGCHLHLEVMANGTKVDPMRWF